MNDMYLLCYFFVQGHYALDFHSLHPPMREIHIMQDYITTEHTFLNLKQKLESWILEKCLHHTIVNVAKNGFNNASNHAHAHLVPSGFELFEDGA
jgi:hypothetical protein